MSRNKLNGRYAGKHQGKHFRTPMTGYPKDDKKPLWINALIEAVRKEK